MTKVLLVLILGVGSVSAGSDQDASLWNWFTKSVKKADAAADKKEESTVREMRHEARSFAEKARALHGHVKAHHEAAHRAYVKAHSKVDVAATSTGAQAHAKNHRKVKIIEGHFGDAKHVAKAVAVEKNEFEVLH